jgi:ABC-type branched-subunit amino acid transport system ATPase component
MAAILEVGQASKNFGGVAAVQNVDLSVEQGSITAVIGPNGAGKTTLFNMVTGFEPLDSGSVQFLGQRIDKLAPWQIARRGLIRSFQTPVGFPVLSVWENLMAAGSKAPQESLGRGIIGGWRRAERTTHRNAQSLLEQLDLWQSRDTRLVDLPPGDVKLVDFARLLMARPKMMLLDEPAAGVDPRSIGRLADLIRGLRDDGITVLVIDHNIGFVLGIADHVNVMALGQVVARGAPSEIVENERVIEIYLGRKR